MEVVYLHAMPGGQATGPVQFQRVPTVGEHLWLQNRPCVVVRVIHSWDPAGSPQAHVYFQPVSTETADFVEPFAPGE